VADDGCRQVQEADAKLGKTSKVMEVCHVALYLDPCAMQPITTKVHLSKMLISDGNLAYDKQP
jgi:hypothetical protein